METLRKLARRMHDAFNGRDLAAVDEIFTPGFVSHPLGTTGPQAVRRSWSAMIERHPELHTVIEDMVVEGDRAVIRSTLHGVPPTPAGRAPEIIELFRAEDGRIAELWGVSTLR